MKTKAGKEMSRPIISITEQKRYFSQKRGLSEAGLFLELKGNFDERTIADLFNRMIDEIKEKRPQ